MRVLEDYRKYPRCPKHVPDDLLNEDQAQTNHSQTLTRLNERGGMGAYEIMCNIHKIRLFEGVNRKKMYDTEYWIDELIKYLETKNL